MKIGLIRKLMAITIATTTILSTTCVSASAEWKQDNKGWWNSEGNSWSVGWRQIDGKWYYFNQDGYMAQNTVIDGQYKVDNNGVWIQNTTINSNNTSVNNVNSNNTTNTNVTNNVNNGIIINGNISIGNTTTNNTAIQQNNNNDSKSGQVSNIPNSDEKPSKSTAYNRSSNPYTNRSIAEKKIFDEKNGFRQVSDNKYVYYEDGELLNNCWKEFNDGIRYFDKNGYMATNTSIDGVPLNSNGTIGIGGDSTDNDEKRKGASGAIALNIEINIKHMTLPYEVNPSEKYSLEYIKYMSDVFDIPLQIEKQTVYNKKEDGKIVNAQERDGDSVHSHSSCESLIIYIGEYQDRLGLN
jgi:hypothetical protein